MTENQRLGRGLSALLGGGVDRTAVAPGPEANAAVPAADSASALTMIPVDAIAPNPGQPRRRFDEAALDALAGSIRDSGLLQPVVVRVVAAGRYELIAGERRWQAAGRAGVAEIPAVVRDADARERLELALVENVVREDLNPMEVARAVAALVEDFGRTHESVATTLGRSRSAISNLLRLLELPDPVQEMVERGELSEGHARAVLQADGAKARRQLAERIVRERLSVRQAEALGRGGTPGRGGRGSAPQEPSPVADQAIDLFYALLGVPVRVRSTSTGTVVELRFVSDDALELALGQLRAGAGLRDVSRETH